MKEEIVQSTAEVGGSTVMLKIAPPVAAGSMILMGVPLSQIALVLTIIYTICMIGGFIYDRFIKKPPKRRKTDADFEDYLLHRIEIAEQHSKHLEEELKHEHEVHSVKKKEE